jgi:ferredoxin
MGDAGFELSRRKFMVLSTAAIAAPFVMNMAGLTANAKGAEEKAVYTIDATCIGCHYCFYECPESAIQWADDKYEIDPEKCVGCGTCAEVCNISAPHPR